MLYNFLRPIVRVLTNLIFRVKVTGTENLPEGAYILSGNHRHNWDPVLLAANIRDRQVHFLAKDVLFKNRFIGWFLKKLYAIPVRREDNDIVAIKNAMKVLKNGEILGLFPEGTRNRTDQKLLEPKGGLVLLAVRKKVPVVPAGISGNFRLFGKVRVNFGEPIYLDDYYGKKLKPEDYITICEDEIYPEIINIPKPFCKARSIGF